jgi:CBS domain-containing protein
MQVKEIMTTNPACCVTQDSLEQAVKLMIDYDCGEIPVVEARETNVPIGVVTDRDIACRTIGKGLNPLEMTVSDVMSTPLVSVKSDATMEECYQMMEENQIRRVPVTDEGDRLVGIVSLADIARNVSKADSGEVLQEVSAVSISASNVG